MGDIGQDLADLDEGKPARSTSRDDQGKFKAGDKPKPVEKPTEKATDKPIEKPKPEREPEETKETEVQKPFEQEPVKPVKAADLRTAYEGLKKRVREEYEPELQRTKAKLQELESRKPEDSAPLLAKVKSAEDRADELEKKIAYLEYTESSDYKTKYETPYKEAWEQAVAEFSELTVTDAATSETRPADESDLLKLGSMRLSDMDQAATEMFGPSAARAINHIQNLRKLSTAQAKAQADAKTKAVEWRKEQEAQSGNQTKAIADAWTATDKELRTRFPKSFEPDKADADDVKSHTTGFAMSDLAFKGAKSLTPEQIEALPAAFRDAVKAKGDLTVPEKVRLHAVVALKAANHDRLLAARRKDKARIAELEKSLAEFEESVPKADNAGGGTKTSTLSFEDEVSQELDKLDRQGR